MTKKQENKPVIETMINTAALALTAFGVNCILARDYYGFIVIIFGGALEFYKYWGRNKGYW